ncbi:hypothetical protein ACH44C_30730 [Streptomyces purpureus]|uniref:hypothetical protein n=1 Tax=Streptomyces purpureus TaxID=1951 RepID=UPI0037B9F4ED
MDDVTWDRADDITVGDALTVGHLLTVLLDRYAIGVVDVPLPEGDVRAGGRSGHLAAIGDAAWARAGERREREGVQSMSVLCELLLRETVAGRVSAGLDAAPRVQQPTQPREEAAGAVTPSLFHSAA